MAKLIKMFKPGKHVAADGKTYEFSEADLRATAAVYDPVLHAAPLVIGHPKMDDPKYGQIQRLEFSGGCLQGEPANVDPAFKEIVNSGKYDRVSTSFYSPSSPGNPVPGVLYPRHLGFLGATPPGCKGLGAVSFAEGEEGLVEFAEAKEVGATGKTMDFGNWEDLVVVRMFRNLRDAWIEKFGKDEADQVFDQYALDALQADALADDPQPGTCSGCGRPCAYCTCGASTHSRDFSEPLKGGATMLTAAQIAAKETELTQRENALKVQETSTKHADNLSFAEGLVKEGKLLPVNKSAVVAVLDFCSGVATGDTIEFGEGDAKKTQSPVEIVKAVLGSYPKLIEFGELFTQEGPGKERKPIPLDICKFV